MQHFNTRVASAPSDTVTKALVKMQFNVSPQNKSLKPTYGKKSGQGSALSGSEIRYLMTKAKENIN